MYRNSFSNQYSNSSLGRTPPNHTLGSSFYPRLPLYPIGPSITQQQFKPINRGFSPSPYANRQPTKPPSYQQRALKTQLNYKQITPEEKEKRLIQRLQMEIQQEAKRRKNMEASYLREIEMVNQNLIRNMERKQKLIAQIDNMKNTQIELHQKLLAMEPPKIDENIQQPFDRKREEIALMMNKLVNRIREKQTEVYAEQEQEQKHWEEQILQKEKMLLNLEQHTKNKRMELLKHRLPIQRPDLISIEDEIRQNHYRDYVYKTELLQAQLKRYIDDRQNMQREVTDVISNKKGQLYNSNKERKDLNAQIVRGRIRIEQLERVSKEIQEANKNLVKQYNRKEQMIQKYQKDIHDLKEKKKLLEDWLKQTLNSFRDKQKEKEFLPDISDEIRRIQQEIRFENTQGIKLKNLYQKLYEMLSTSTSKNIHDVFKPFIV